MIKEKVKEIWKEHKKEIIVTTGVSVLGVLVGCQLGYRKTLLKYYVIDNHEWGNYIRDVLLSGDALGNKSVYCGVTEEFKPESLGKLGTNMIDVGANPNQTYTHFIAIGKKNNL